MRTDRIKALQQATHQYVDAEKKRIENEVSVLKAILDGRTAGRGIQAKGTTTVVAVAEADLAAYLMGS